MDMMLSTEPEIRAELGKRLTRVRLESGLSQAELALKAGLGVATLQRFEQGQGATLTTLIQILMALRRVDDLDHLMVAPMLTIKSLESQARGSMRKRVSRKPRVSSKL